ncbi:hypothetical protein GCM10008955_09710 [Deinococcus malanensis]|uniref:Uncharacterized protein n=1 Tax=Deinococcus malanensis TaxID=1706855 RepID=A0ABQ2ER54_9DEIO|nr:hypothetical protein GCM10008955_09710 [Deinococcus malanensis]
MSLERIPDPGQRARSGLRVTVLLLLYQDSRAYLPCPAAYPKIRDLEKEELMIRRAAEPPFLRMGRLDLTVSDQTDGLGRM